MENAIKRNDFEVVQEGVQVKNVEESSKLCHDFYVGCSLSSSISIYCLHNFKTKASYIQKMGKLCILQIPYCMLSYIFVQCLIINHLSFIVLIPERLLFPPGTKWILGRFP